MAIVLPYQSNLQGSMVVFAALSNPVFAWSDRQNVYQNIPYTYQRLPMFLTDLI